MTYVVINAGQAEKLSAAIQVINPTTIHQLVEVQKGAWLMIYTP